MAIPKARGVTTDREPLYRSTSRTTPAAIVNPLVAPAVPATTAAIQTAIAPPPVVATAPTYNFDPAVVQNALANLNLPAVTPTTTPSTALPVADAQYRGEPITRTDSGVNYAAPVNPLTPVQPPATTQAIQAAVAPPPAAAIPSIQDYLAQKGAAFNPVTLREPDDGGSEGVSSPGQYSSYDPTADIAEYKRLYGAQANPWDILAAETPGKESYGGGLSNFTRTYTPYTVQELQDQFLSEQAKLTPEAFAKIKASQRPAPDYATYLANYDKKFQALPENLKQRAGLQGELLNQAGAYGFKWDTRGVPAGHHTYNIAKLLEKSNVKSIGDLEWRTVNGKDKLFNKATNQPVDMHKDDAKNPTMLGWSPEGKGLVRYYVKKDVEGRPVITPQWKSNAPGGVLGTALKLAPVALAFVPGIGPALSAGAAGLNAAVQGGNIGDILKSAGTSYLGGQVGGMAGEAVKAATQSMAPGIGGALTGAATGGASAATTGALRGDLNLKNIATGALTGGAVGGISDLVSTYLPVKGELQDQIRSPGSTAAPVSGSTFVDNVLRNAAVRAPGTLLGGGNLQNLLVGSVAGEAGKTAAGYLPSTGIDFIDKLAGGFMQAGVQKELKDILGNQPSAPGMKDRDAMAVGPRDPAGYVPPSGAGNYAQAPAPVGPAASVVAETPQKDNSGLMAMLIGMGLMGDESAQAAPAAPAMFNPEYFTPGQKQQPADILAMLKSLQDKA